MKKLLLGLYSFVIFGPLVSTTVSCSIGNNSCLPYLNSLSDYDWTSEPDGDGLNYATQNADSVISSPQFKNVTATEGPVSRVFNYDKYLTGYKTKPWILKQGVTGSPIVKSYRPNGNTWSDLGISSHSRAFSTINSVLDWNKDDLDLKYNVANVDLKKRNYVAKSSVTSQQNDVYLNITHDKGNSNSSIVGTKKPLGATVTNLSYLHDFIGWGWGSSNLGWLSPPTADYTELLHRNGIQSMGLLYLSGWEDTTKEKLKKLLEKDSYGNYKIVDVLIQQCLQLNFDGWFINNEANGGHSSGTVLDDSEMNEIIREFNIKANDIYEKQGKNLRIIWYHNTASIDETGSFSDGSSLVYDALSQTQTVENNQTKNRTDIQLDFFRQFPGYENAFFGEDDNQQKISHNSSSSALSIDDDFRKHLYTLYYYGASNASVGTYNINKYFYPMSSYTDWKKATANSDNKMMTFNKTNSPATSFSLFGADESSFSNSVTNLFMKQISDDDKDADWEKVKAYLFGQETYNQFSTYLYSGMNGYMTNDDYGADDLWDSSAIKDEKTYNEQVKHVKNDEKISDISSEELVKLDPRIDLGKSNEEQTNKIPERFQYDFSNGTEGASYGLGNNYVEQTVVTDSYLDRDDKEVFGNDPSLTTNFSTGSGIEFINRDSEGNIIEDAKKYPWTNERLSDTLPTYQWDFWSTDSADGVTTNTSDGVKYRSKITQDGQLNGYYDYFDPYQKGNCISIGGGYDMTSLEDGGKVKTAQWGNGPYNWNIMGTNLQNNQYNVSFVVKATDYNQNFDDISKGTKVIVTTSNGEVAQPLDNLDTNLKDMGNGWYKVSASLSNVENVSANNRIAKLGIQIDPNHLTSKFVFKVGEFSINKDGVTLSSNDANINNIQNEYMVKRDNYSDIRLVWNVNNEAAIKYYEIYYLIDNKWYRVGETNSLNYYIHNLTNVNSVLTIGVRIVYQDSNESELFKSSFSANYNDL